jgi:hypothetical protein
MKNEIMLFARKWMELEIIMLNENQPHQTNTAFFSHFLETSRR